MDLKYAEIFAILCGLLLIAWAAAEQKKGPAPLFPDSKFRQTQITAMEQQIADLKNDLIKTKARVKRYEKELAESGNPAEVTQPHEEAPIITLSEHEAAFKFSSGSAIISPEFRETLEMKIFPKIRQKSEEYGCDVLMVIGHTDERQVRSTAKEGSTLDNRLSEAYRNRSLDGLTAGSNTDLGMVRALSVAIFLEQNRNQFPKVKYFLPYSAGQIIRLDRSLSTSPLGPEVLGERDDSRRRIELQLTKSSFWKAEDPNL